MDVHSPPITHFTCDQGRLKPEKAMDPSKYPNPKVHNRFLSHNSKRMIKLLLLSVLLSLLPLLFLSFNPFLMQQFFSRTVDKSYMFLICNGLMVFIAMNSGLISAFSPATNQSSRLEFNESEIAAPIAGENVTAVESPQEKENSLMMMEQENASSDAQEDEGKSLMIVDKEDALSDAREDEVEGNAIIEPDDHGHVAEDTEELNKKCEDFIRKMRAAFISDQYSLALVY